MQNMILLITHFDTHNIKKLFLIFNLILSIDKNIQSNIGTSSHV